MAYWYTKKCVFLIYRKINWKHALGSFPEIQIQQDPVHSTQFTHFTSFM